jgi:hypothetical protein
MRVITGSSSLLAITAAAAPTSPSITWIRCQLIPLEGLKPVVAVYSLGETIDAILDRTIVGKIVIEPTR